MFTKSIKTTATVLATFTKDLEIIAQAQMGISEKAEKREAIAKQQKMEAVAESALAKQAIANITKMLGL